MSLYDKLEKLDISASDSSFAVMGRLEHVRLIIKWLRERGIEPAYIFDNDRNKHGTHSDGVRIKAPSVQYSGDGGRLKVVIYSPKYWEEMTEQLIKLGYTDREEILVIDRPSPEGNLELTKKGMDFYSKLKNRYGEDVQLFLANCPLGDYYLLGLYFNEYLKRNDIRNYVLLGESAGIEKLSGWFRIKPALRITPDESNALIRAFVFCGDKIKLKPLTIWQGAFRHNPCVARQKEGFSFMDTFRSMIYNLPPETEPEYPERVHNIKKVQDIFISGGLKPGKTVLISPFSYSLPSMDEGFWNALADRIREAGYSVAVNLGEEREENMIKGALPVSLDFMEIMDFMEYAGTVIGMRSGFFDITSPADCSRIILYPKKLGMVQWNSNDIGFCSLRSMGLRNDATEIEVSGNNAETIDRILMSL